MALKLDQDLESYLFSNLVSKAKHEKTFHQTKVDKSDDFNDKIKSYEVSNLNNKIISIQNLATIYQCQYISRRKGQLTPAIYSLIVETRLLNDVKRHFQVWAECSRNQQVFSMMDSSRIYRTKRKVSISLLSTHMSTLHI